MRLADEILRAISKWKAAPSTQRIRDKFKLVAWSEINQALEQLRDERKIACTNKRWHLLGQAPQFGRTEDLRRRKPKKVAPKSAAARTVPLVGGDS